ncbi:MAG: hypothetical protein ABEJ93_03125 [Candidatus Nanohalobium sp.]
MPEGEEEDIEEHLEETGYTVGDCDWDVLEGKLEGVLHDREEVLIHEDYDIEEALSSEPEENEDSGYFESVKNYLSGKTGALLGGGLASGALSFGTNALGYSLATTALWSGGLLGVGLGAAGLGWKYLSGGEETEGDPYNGPEEIRDYEVVYADEELFIQDEGEGDGEE